MYTTTLLILSPILASVIVPVAGLAVYKIGGIEKRVDAWLIAHKQTAAAADLDAAWNVANGLILTGASVLAGQVQSGKLDWTNRSALEAAAIAEVALVKARAPAQIATIMAQPGFQPGTLLVQMMGAVDAQVVASSPIGQPAPVAADMLGDAVKTIAGARAALGTLDAAAQPAPAALAA